MIEPLATLLRDAELQIRGEQTYPAIAEWLIAHGVTLGPASPVRPSDHADSSRTHNAASTGSPVRNPTQEAGIAAKKIVEWRALAEQISANVAGLEDQHYFGDAGRLDAKARQLEACADDLEAALVVPVRDPAPPDEWGVVSDGSGHYGVSCDVVSAVVFDTEDDAKIASWCCCRGIAAKR